MKNSFPLYYCPKHLWLCLSIGTLSVAFLTLLILVIYHSHRYSRRKITTHLERRNVDEQVDELLRSTPILPFEHHKFNQVNQIKFQPLHSLGTDLPDKPNGIHSR